MVNLRNKFGATPLHLLCLNFDENNMPFTEAITAPKEALDQLILAGADINCQDIYGYSVLHYAVYSRNKDIVTKLLELGADAELRDENGLNPKHCCQSLGFNEIYNSFPGMSEDDEITDEKDDCFLMPVKMSNVSACLTSNMDKLKLSDDKIRKLLQSTGTDRLSNSQEKNAVWKKLLALMTGVFEEVECLDARFKVIIEISGSTREGTKAEAPDEFDLLCFLDKFESVCDIEEYGQDIVICKLREGIQSSSYKSLFDERRLLLGNRLTTALYLCIRKALSNPSVWKYAPGLCLDNSKDDYVLERDVSGIRYLYFRYCDATYKDLAVSCDIVPAIKKTQWWPSFAKEEGILVSSEIRGNGCMVIAKPCMELTLTGEIVRLLTHFKASVYLSECRILLSLPPAILQAYKLAKLLKKKRHLYPSIVEDSKAEELVTNTDDGDNEEGAFNNIPQSWHPAHTVTIVTGYMLKNAFLYELESEYNQLSKTNELNISVTRAWTVRIFRHLRHFLEDGSLASYFLPQKSIIPALEPRFGTMNKIASSFCEIIASILEGSE